MGHADCDLLVDAILSSDGGGHQAAQAVGTRLTASQGGDGIATRPARGLRRLGIREARRQRVDAASSLGFIGSGEDEEHHHARGSQLMMSLGRHRYNLLQPESAKSLCLVCVCQCCCKGDQVLHCEESCVLLMQTAVALLYLGFGAAYSGIMAACGGRWRRKRVSGDPHAITVSFFFFFFFSKTHQCKLVARKTPGSNRLHTHRLACSIVCMYRSPIPPPQIQLKNLIIKSFR